MQPVMDGGCVGEKRGEVFCSHIICRVRERAKGRCEVGLSGLHQIEQPSDQLFIIRLLRHKAEFMAHLLEPRGLVLAGKSRNRIGGERNGSLLVIINQGKQRLGEAGEIPLRDPRLVCIGIAPEFINRAEYLH